jgi:ribosomal protein L37E
LLRLIGDLCESYDDARTYKPSIYKKYLLKQRNIDELCRRCGKESEKIQHITAACEQLAPTEYLKIHNGLAKIMHQKLAEAAELIEERTLYYKYTPASVLEKDNFKLYWNRSILTDKTVPFNRPDITFMNKKTNNTFLIDIAVPNNKPINTNTKNWRMKYVLCGSKTHLK